VQTDRTPKNVKRKEEYLRSDDMKSIELPPAEPFRSLASKIKEAMATESTRSVQIACGNLLNALADFYGVAHPGIKVLAARPRKSTDNWVYETFGDYDPETARIRLWMRTAVQKKTTSFGTFFSTLCHEFLHHLDMVSLNFPNTYHTRGFFERTALLYHHLQDTPVRHIVWVKQTNGTYRVDWAGTMRSASPAASSPSKAKSTPNGVPQFKAVASSRTAPAPGPRRSAPASPDRGTKGTN
jgi:hypothetical protein